MPSDSPLRQVLTARPEVSAAVDSRAARSFASMAATPLSSPVAKSPYLKAGATRSSSRRPVAPSDNTPSSP